MNLLNRHLPGTKDLFPMWSDERKTPPPGAVVTGAPGVDLHNNPLHMKIVFSAPCVLCGWKNAPSRKSELSSRWSRLTFRFGPGRHWSNQSCGTGGDRGGCGGHTQKTEMYFLIFLVTESCIIFTNSFCQNRHEII